MSKLVKEYFNYQQEFVQKYGSNTIVLMQVGSFYEFYGLNTEQLTYNSIDANLTLDNTHMTPRAMVEFFVALPTVSSKTLTISDNDYIDLLSDEEKEIATDKGWTLSLSGA